MCIEASLFNYIWKYYTTVYLVLSNYDIDLYKIL